MNDPNDDHGLAADRTGAATFARGRSAEEAGDLEVAHGLYCEALERRPDDPDWLYRLGCVCLKSGRYGEARRRFRAGLERRPGDARMLTNLGVALDHLGHREEALLAYQRATFLDDAPAAAHHNLGSLYAEDGRHEDAVRAFTDAVRLAPDAASYCSLGLVLQGMGDLVRALEAFESSVRCDRQYGRGHYHAAVCLLRRGRYQEALARFDVVLRLEPGLTRTHFHRGVCLHKLERYKPALAALTEAEAAYPEDSRIHFQLGLTCDALGLAAEARRHYHLARLLRSDPAAEAGSAS
jgi:tetratricopeptide (TPR) repeat protein